MTHALSCKSVGWLEGNVRHRNSKYLPKTRDLRARIYPLAGQSGEHSACVRTGESVTHKLRLRILTLADVPLFTGSV